MSDSAFNRFVNLDSIEGRIINYLITSTNADAERLWKLLRYNDKNALSYDNLTKQEKSALIYTGEESQSDDKRVFMQSYIEDRFSVQCSLLKIYVDSIVPINHLLSIVNVGIDIMSHNKIQIVINDSFDELENPDTYRQIEEAILYKNRNTLLLKCLLSILNGATVEGVGQFQFNQKLSVFSQSKSGIFDNRQYNGSKNIFAVNMSGVSPL